MEHHTQSFRFFNRGPSPLVRLIFFVALSLLLLFVDARYQYLESARKVLSILVQPIQRVATAPAKIWQQLSEFFTTQSTLLADNQQLRQQHGADMAHGQQMQFIQAENQQLRQLVAAQQRASYPMQMAEIVYVERDVFKRKVFVDKGAQANVQTGQVVLDDGGVVGQVTRVYPLLSEVTLITDKDHAVPVQVLRNGLRAVVFGAGDIHTLTLRYMPISVDIQNDDVLVTSGIDGTYPAGLPVARVSKIERDAAYPFARIVCTPIAGVDRQRHLLIVSGLPKLPEAPPVEEPASDTPKKKIKRKKP
jgi:rod shape-determining protein MreC